MACNSKINAGSAYKLPGAEQELPTYGILKQTLIRTPVVKQIVPARIRGEEFNDVVFVGETYIELHLLGDDGKLRKIASKVDFEADIRHAIVFATRNTFEGMQDILPDDIMLEDTKRKLPPHILVLTLDSGYIGFLYAVTKGNEVEFIMSTLKVDEKGVKPKTLGKSLAVDPKSRCLAVTAYQDSFQIFSLHEPDELERQLQTKKPLRPVREDKCFTVSGLILHLEFLHPTPSDADHVILVIFIVDAKQKFRLMLYEWCTSMPFSTAKQSQPGLYGLPLPAEVKIPLHLVPLLVGTAFLLISETCIHAIRASDIITSGNLSALTKFEFSQVSSDRGKQSLVTSWARPLRTSSHTQTMDDLYLAMENGDIFFLELGSEGPNLVKLMNKAGHLDCAIGSAFAALDYGLERNDLVIAGGEMSSGGIYLIEPSSPVSSSNSGIDDEPRLEETVANWSPVFDFDLINHSAQGYAQGRATRDRVYACTGRGEHGAIAEIRWGVQGLMQSLAQYSPGIRNIWILPNSEGSGFFLLCSFPAQSALLCYRDEPREWVDVTDFDLLDMVHTTIAAAAVGQKSVQVTPQAVKIHALKEEILERRRTPSGDIIMTDGDTDEDTSMSNMSARTIWTWECGAKDQIVTAAIQDIYLVLVIRTTDSIKMTLETILPEMDAEGSFLKQIGSDITLNEDPSFVTISEISGQFLAVVGTREATIQFYLIDSTNGLVPTLEQSLLRESDADNTVQRDLFICESAVPIQSSTSTKLLCGLRDGTLVTFDTRISSGDLQLVRRDDIQFGPIPVQVLPHAQRRDVVLVLASPELYRFSLSASEVKVSQIVFEGTLVEPTIVAVSQIDNSPGQESFIVCATRDQIFYAEVGLSEKVCVRRLPLLETPKRLLYYKYKPLNVLIVAVSKNGLIEPAGRPNAGSKTTGTYASLCFLDPRTGELLGKDPELMDNNSSKGDLIFGKQNEQIYGLSEWNVVLETKDGPKNYRYVAICTGFINLAPHQSQKGRVIIISVLLNSFGKIEVRRRHQINCDAPVYSVASYGNRSIVYCTGNKLCMKRLNNDVQSKRLEEIAEFRLRSPAGQITVNEPYINCSCATDSLCIIKFEEAQPPQRSRFHLHYSDEKARPGFSHYSPLENLFLASDKEYGIVGLWQPPNRRNTGSLTTLFDTEVTSSISRIRGGSLRPPWHARKTRPGVLLPDKDIIGSGVDGSIFHLTLLNVDALRLLRYIQGMYTTELETRKHSVNSSPRVSAISTRLRMDVDGDALHSVVKLGEDWLRKAVRKEEPNAQAGGKAGMSFEEMVEKLLGPVVVAEDVGKDGVARSLEYMKKLLDAVVL